MKRVVYYNHAKPNEKETYKKSKSCKKKVWFSLLNYVNTLRRMIVIEVAWL